MDDFHQARRRHLGLPALRRDPRLRAGRSYRRRRIIIGASAMHAEIKQGARNPHAVLLGTKPAKDENLLDKMGPLLRDARKARL